MDVDDVKQRFMMWKRSAALTVCTLLLSACTSETPVQSQSGGSDAQAEITSIIETYDRVVTEMNLELFLTIVADPDSVSIVSPAGRVGAAELEGFFDGLRNTYSEVDIVLSNLVIQSEGAMGWATFDFAFEGALADGQEVAFSGWETQIHRRTDDGWGIAHIHYSVPFVPPVADDQ
jgi:ketosteroid isomerase-like protein